MFEQDETRNFEGKHTAMAGAAPSVDTAVTPMPAMAVESNSTNNTVLVESRDHCRRSAGVIVARLSMFVQHSFDIVYVGDPKTELTGHPRQNLRTT